MSEKMANVCHTYRGRCTTSEGEMECALSDPVKGVRIIMHYNTGVSLPKPSDADTFSWITHGPVGKGEYLHRSSVDGIDHSRELMHGSNR